MVNIGRPSSSCNNCRARKRRCDQVLPKCRPCLRLGLDCIYRDTSTFVFHDESSNVIDRARSRANKKTASRNGPSSGYDSSTNAATPEVTLAQSTLSDDMNSILANDDFNVDIFGLQNVLNTEDGLFSMPAFYNDSLDSTPASSCGTTLPRAEASLEFGCAGDEPSGEDSHGSRVSGESIYNDHENFSSPAASPETIARPFALPLDMFALNYFMSRYVVPKSGPSSGFLDYTSAILAREDGRETLQGAILALGYIGLARSTQQSDLMRRSSWMYAQTTERIDGALADAQAARQDGTIVTILILALYEFSMSSLEGWQNHIKSAASLLALRGKTQFATSVGVQIFKNVFHHLLISCLYVGCELPSGMRMLRIEAAGAIGASDPYWVACSAGIELADLYRHISPEDYTLISGSDSNPTSSSSSFSGPSKTSNMCVEDLERYLSQALEIDQRLESRFAECSPEWRFTVTRGSPSSPLDSTRVHGDTYHIYHDVWVASVWNMMRICRIVANHAIGHLLLRGATVDPAWFFSNQYAGRLQQVSEIVVKLRGDMLASVPQQMGHVGPPTQGQQRHLEVSMSGLCDLSNPAEIPSVKSSAYSPCVFGSDQVGYSGVAAGGYFASWTLLITGSMLSVGDETRAWTVAQLRKISSEAALGQAELFATCVESKRLRLPLR